MLLCVYLHLLPEQTAAGVCGHFRPDKIPLGMEAYRTDSRCFFSGVQMAAVLAHPHTTGVAVGKQGIPSKPCFKLAEPFGVHGFDFCNFPEYGGRAGVAVPVRLCRECRIYIIGFRQFVVLCRLQNFCQRRIDIYRETAVNVQGLSRGIPQQIIEYSGMCPFLIGGVQEYFLQYIQVFLFRTSGGNGVAVSRLAFTGKGTHQVQLGFVWGKGHMKTSRFSWISETVCPSG